MTVTAEDALQSLRRRWTSGRAEAEERARRLLALLPAAVEILRGRFGVGRIWLFGSLATGDARLTSDVDLAVEGLRSDRQIEALDAVMLALRCPVDLVRLETAPESLVERILTEGRPL